MGQDKKKQLTKLLAFVKELYDHPDNKDFAAGIQAIVLGDKDFAERLKEGSFQGDPETLQKIETYLSLDFDIDSRSLPDYSFITDVPSRERLQSDYREMLRYEFGTRSHKIDFAEFCRFAVLQIEMLTNYYFDKKYNSDIATLIQVFVTNFPKFNAYAGLKNVSEIQLKTKLYQLRNEFQWDRKDLNPFLYAIEVRNNQSHRSLRVDRDLIKETEEKLKAAGAWNKKYSSPDYTKALSTIGQDTLNAYNFQVWLDKQPFEEVRTAIGHLTETISAALQQPA